jgi:hypothetical protein
MELFQRLRSRPKLDRLEDRDVPAVVAASATTMLVETPTINDKVIAYLDARLGRRVGGGECAHAATEALRAAGAAFIRPADAPNPGDYVWGSLVKVITAAGDSAPGVACKPGDVIQYRNATFNNGMWATHHTSIVAAVDPQGRPTAVYEQNFAGERVVRLHSFDATQLTGGWLRVYRGVPRVTVPGRTEFTLVNNVRGIRGGTMRVGGYNLGPFHLGPVNTVNSYQTRYVTATPVLVVRITVGLTTVNVVNGGAYELYLRGGRMSVRRIG